MDDAPIPLMTDAKRHAEAAPTEAPAEPAEAPMPPAPSPVHPHNWGGLIGIIIIVSLIITAALYSWGERLATEPPVQTTE